MEDASVVVDPMLNTLVKDKKSGYNYQERKREDWTDTYDYYRGKPQINRLIQRQSVHVPLTKQTIKTLMKDIDDMPVLFFENLDNDKEAEVLQNAHWEETIRCNKMEILDIIDKRQEMLFGRTYDQFQIVDGKIKVTIESAYDIFVDRYVDTSNIHSSRFLVHTHIFKPISVLEKNTEYDQKAVAELKRWHGTKEGLIKASHNEQAQTERNQRMSDLGLEDVDNPILGETIVELSLHFRYHQEKDEEEQIWLFVEADDHVILQAERLEKIIGETKDHYWQNHYPYNSWADDIDRDDWYTDGVGDTVRENNKVIDVFYSQQVENRTLRNFGMNFYDATIEGFQPQTLPPQAFGWYGLPGKPQDVFQKVDIPDLSESMDEMQFIIDMNDRATGATATQQGVENKRQVTLGEVQLALSEAKERVKGMSKFYTQVWKERGEMYLKLIEAAHDRIDTVTVSKKGKSTSTIYSRDISPKDWMTKAGYSCKVWSQDEKNEKDIQSLEKINAIAMIIPGNPKLEEIRQRKALEFAGLNPDEVNEVMQIEEQKRAMQMSMVGQGLEPPGVPQMAAQPGQPRPQPQPIMNQPMN